MRKVNIRCIVGPIWPLLLWHQVEKGEVNVLAIGGNTKVKGLEHVPSWLEFVPENHPKRPIVEAVSTEASIGLSLIAPPGVPADRIAYLREVLRKTVNDPAYLAEAEERKIPVSFASGEELEEILKKASSVTPEVQEWFRGLLKN